VASWRFVLISTKHIIFHYTGSTSITSSFNLDITLNIILEQMLAQLHIDAADISIPKGHRRNKFRIIFQVQDAPVADGHPKDVGLQVLQRQLSAAINRG
jgi:hypothetical protein